MFTVDTVAALTASHCRFEEMFLKVVFLISNENTFCNYFVLRRLSSLTWLTELSDRRRMNDQTVFFPLQKLSQVKCAVLIKVYIFKHFSKNMTRVVMIC